MREVKEECSIPILFAQLDHFLRDASYLTPRPRYARVFVLSAIFGVAANTRAPFDTAGHTAKTACFLKNGLDVYNETHTKNINGSTKI